MRDAGCGMRDAGDGLSSLSLLSGCRVVGLRVSISMFKVTGCGLRDTGYGFQVIALMNVDRFNSYFLFFISCFLFSFLVTHLHRAGIFNIESIPKTIFCYQNTKTQNLTKTNPMNISLLCNLESWSRGMVAFFIF
jgi:hypothetical protein